MYDAHLLMTVNQSLKTSLVNEQPIELLSGANYAAFYRLSEVKIAYITDEQMYFISK